MKSGMRKRLKKVVTVVLAAVLALGSIPFALQGMETKAATLSNGLTETTAQADVEYTFTLAGLDGGVYKHTAGTSLGLLKFISNTSNNGAHGLQVNGGGSFSIQVAGAATITIKSCQYASATELNMNGEQGQNPKTASCGDELVYEYNGGAGEVTFNSVDGSVYIHEIIVKPNPYAPTTTVWNFRGGEEGAFAEKVQGASTNFNGLEIDATAGKCYSRFDQAGKLDTQINSGTKLIVPVPAESSYDLVIYSRADMVWTVNGNPMQLSSELTDETGWGGYFVYSGETDAATTSVEVLAGANKYMKEVKLVTRPVQAPEKLGNGKVDVVDFGAEALDAAAYNNLLTVDIANSFYGAETAPGSTGVNVGDFTVNDSDGNAFLKFCAGGKTNNRYRTTNEAITRYDAKDKMDAAGNTYNGFIYSNSSSADTVYMSFYLYENDILKVMAGSNGNAATYAFVSPSGETTYADFTNASGVEELAFFAGEEGEYKLWCTNEKLVVARATREHTQPVKVSGTSTYNDLDATGSPAPSGYSIAFKNRLTGAVTSAPVMGDGSYKAYLYEQYSYDVSLENANGYVIYSDAAIEIPAGAGNQNFDISVKPVKVLSITGSIQGLSAEALAKLQLNFSSNEVYVPEIAVNADGTFVLKVEAGVAYDVTAVDVNDYILKTTSFSAAADGTAAIVFEAKPVYNVEAALDGVSEEDARAAVVTFTNIAEKYSDGTAYTYQYRYGDSMKLRDGQYSVKVEGLGKLAVRQAPTADVKVDGAGGATTVKFYAVTDWDFAKYNANPGIETVGEDKYYVGLALSAANIMENKTYLLANADGTIDVPVKAGDRVQLSYCYQAAFQIGDQVFTSASGSTTKIETVTVQADKTGMMRITGITATDAESSKEVKQTYFTQIKVTTPSAYREVLEVGADKEFKTINAALDAVESMSRPNGERVTVMIAPGNYEEMLVVDMPNVTLKNAAAYPSIDLKNQGVDVADGAVRITSYYGHGYSYYSMGSDCKYDEDLLKANKANGYESFTNPGSGTTNGSYWNATVMISADGFNADGIIFENSFNQYVSEKAANDVIVPQSGAKGEAKGARNDMEAGSTQVQDKAYVERAAALAIGNDITGSDFSNCKFIGRQDTLYGGVNSTVVFDECSIYGGTDYIFGGMVAVFYKCDLVANTSADGNDTFYITAAQQTAGRGYLMYNCTITSTTPGVDTASENTSKPGYLGRPWQGVTSEVVFYNTVIESTNFYDPDGTGNYGVQETPVSLINDVGWLTTLGGQSEKCYEYGTIELDGSTPKRADWSHVLTEPVLTDGAKAELASFMNSDWLAAVQTAGRLAENSDVNYTHLNAAVKEAEGLNAAGYVSFAEVQTLLEQVKGIDQSQVGAASQVKVNQLYAALKNAMNKLVAGTPDGGSDGPGGLDGSDGSISTGDSYHTLLWMCMAAVGAAGCAAAGFRRKNKKRV